MTESSSADRRGIEIPEDIAGAARIPDDLDAGAPSEYAMPDVGRRRQTAIVYFASALIAAGAALAGVSDGMWVLSVVLLAIAGYHVAAGKSLGVREARALELANRETSFAVGHASAALGFNGLLARPIWNVLVFSADDPPTERGLVRVDAIDGSIVEQYVERINPEG